MRDMPVFTTEFGAASLTLKEIPYKKEAYIQLQDSLDPELLLEECVDFCRCAGAEKIFASGHDFLQKYPVHTTVIRMQCRRNELRDTDAALFPVQKETLEEFRCIYNDRMQSVPNASYMTARDAEQYLQERGCYFIHCRGDLLGIGIVSGNEICAVASVMRGSGEDIILALNQCLAGETVIVETASNNIPAISLYERLGFVKISEISKWYEILDV